MKGPHLHECAGCRDLRRRLDDLERGASAVRAPAWTPLPRLLRRDPAHVLRRTSHREGNSNAYRAFAGLSEPSETIPFHGATLDLVA